MSFLKKKQFDRIQNYTKLFEMLFSGKKPIYVMGRNKYAEHVSGVLNRHSRDINAFIDDFIEGQEFLGKPVISSSDLPSDCIVVSCVVDCKPLSALNRLKTCGVVNVIDYYSLAALKPGEYPLPHSSENSERDIRINCDKYEWLREVLDDPLSLETLDRIVAFRCTFDLEIMKFFTYRIQEQYFEDFLALGGNEVFVDGGGFDGATTARFIQNVVDYEKIYFFEPQPDMLRLSKERLSLHSNIIFLPKGLYNKSMLLKFDSTMGSGSRISDIGDKTIECVALDDVISGKITFLKLDVEGAEFEALEGARRTIIEYHPRIAVCIYHNQQHFWRIPEYLLSLKDDYHVFLRHYTEGILETVMYFV